MILAASGALYDAPLAFCPGVGLGIVGKTLFHCFYNICLFFAFITKMDIGVLCNGIKVSRMSSIC